MNKFHSIYLVGKKTNGKMWFFGEILEKTVYIKARSFMAKTLEKMGRTAKLKEKQLWSTGQRNNSNDTFSLCKNVQ